MADEKITLDQQIDALEITIANSRGYIENLEKLVRQKQREAVWLDIAKTRQPKLVAALNTLKWLKKNESTIRSALSK